jgi:hypothetical protein
VDVRLDRSDIDVFVLWSIDSEFAAQNSCTQSTERKSVVWGSRTQIWLRRGVLVNWCKRIERTDFDGV